MPASPTSTKSGATCNPANAAFVAWCASLFKREGRRDNFSGRSWFRCEGKRPRKTPPLGESCGGVPGPCALGERDKLWGHRGNASGGDVFREPFRSDRIAVLIRTLTSAN